MRAKGKKSEHDDMTIEQNNTEKRTKRGREWHGTQTNERYLLGRSLSNCLNFVEEKSHSYSERQKTTYLFLNFKKE